MLRPALSLVAVIAGVSLGSQAATFDAPGFKPKAHPRQVLTGATVIPRPGVVLSNATIVIKDSRIEQVGQGLAIPTDARVRHYPGRTIYAGFIDPMWTVSASHASVRSPSGDGAARMDGLTSGGPRFFGVPGGEIDPGRPGAGHAVASVAPEHRTATGYTHDKAALSAMRELGFTAGNLVPTQGIFRGQSALVQLGDLDPSETVLAAAVWQHVSFDTDTPGESAYPKSMMGVVSLVRQVFSDARFEIDRRGATTGSPAPKPFSPWLESLAPAVEKKQKVVFEPGSALMGRRAATLALELGLDAIMVSSGQEWRRPDLLRGLGMPFIVPLVFPEVAKLPNDQDWDDVSLDQLRTWDWAPENPVVLRQAGLELSFTTYGLGDRKKFWKNLRSATRRGLSADDALAGLTTMPAKWLGVAEHLGVIEPGRLANLTVFENGGFLAEKSRVAEVWIHGDAYPVSVAPAPSTSTNAPSTNSISSGRTARSPQDDRGPLSRDSAVLIRGATVWTSSKAGRLEQADLLISGGKIRSVGRSIDAAALGISSPLVIEGAGKHVTPGLIDAHSHSMILGAVNEGTIPSTAMVRVEDVINSETLNIYLQLAGGLTTANQLHGSANPIGGQSWVIKLRDGEPPDGLRFGGAPPGIKFALGENVKQSNWGDARTTRFPQSRMGVRTFLANRFTAAREYLALKKAAGSAPFRRDFELETLGEILEGKRWIHCHSYRQDEILMFLRLMEDFGVKVGTLQHVLEGYKVADEIARHGAGASTFADWWAFKFEVYDAIPFNGSLMRDRGVVVSFNSDSSDFARRLNTEAAKAVKYGGTREEDALAFVTIHPARQLRIEDRVGSLEAGKDADFVIWSGSPLDARSVCLQTWIDGKKYFDNVEDAARRQALAAERVALLAKAKRVAASGGAGDPAAPEAKKFFERSLEHEWDSRDRHCLDEEDHE